MQMKVENQIGLLLAFERPFKSNNQTSFLITFLTWKIYKKKKKTKEKLFRCGRRCKRDQKNFFVPSPPFESEKFSCFNAFQNDSSLFYERHEFGFSSTS